MHDITGQKEHCATGAAFYVPRVSNSGSVEECIYFWFACPVTCFYYLQELDDAIDCFTKASVLDSGDPYPRS